MPAPERPSSDLVVVYCDGSSLGNPGVGGWAWWCHDGCWSAGSLPHTTNQQAELIALLMVIIQVPGRHPLLVKTDSQYARNIVTSWMYQWKRKNWTTKSGTPVANLKLVQRLHDAIQLRTSEVAVDWVPGHAGVPGNEAADLAAGRAADAEKRRRAVNTGPGWTGPVPSRGAPRAGGSAASRWGAAPPVPGRSSASGSRSGGSSRSVRGPQAGARGAGRRADDIARVSTSSLTGGAMCPSCGKPVNPYSLECGCSR